MNRVICLIIIGLLSFSANAQKKYVIIEGKIPDSLKVEKIPIRIFSAFIVDLVNEPKDTFIQVINNRFRYQLEVDSPMVVTSTKLFGGPYPHFIAEYGDSIYVSGLGINANITGIGSPKLELVRKAYKLNIPVKSESKSKLDNVLSRYLNYSKFVDSVVLTMNEFIKPFQSKMTTFAFTLLSADILYYIEEHRLSAFSRLINEREKVAADDSLLMKIFDATIKHSEVGSLNISDTMILGGNVTNGYMRSFVPLALRREKQFARENTYTGSSLQRYFDLYDFAKTNYSRGAEQWYLSFIIRKYLLGKGGISPDVMEYVNDFLATPGYPKYKQWLRTLVEKTASLEEGEYAPTFEFEGTDGQKISLKKLKGKTVILDFWFTGCAGCVQMAPAISKVEQQFKKDTNIVFLSISIDEDKSKWLKSVNTGRYTSKHSLHAYTGGLGDNHPAIKDYNVGSYPKIIVINPYQRMAVYPAPDPRVDKGQALSDLLRKLSLEKLDGPYVLYDQDKMVIKSIPAQIKEEALAVASDIPGKYFKVHLKQSLKIEPSIYSSPAKMIVISDIEGNFSAFRKLLQASNVIDSNLNWKFGNGHLVLLGDFFDRGNQVTEAFWLIYKLEQEAKEKGGYVHFILGNHEIMNLQGDLRYIQPKYYASTELLQESYSTLWGKDSELGRWLRTKNIIEKIGDYLYVHGGISQEIASFPLTIDQINHIARPHFDNPNAVSVNDTLMRVYHGNNSPFWYRGYYSSSSEKKASDSLVVATLKKFEVRHIVTGHSINKSGRIDTYYEGKVINVDVPHAEGKSECLIIEGNRWFRVDQKGNRIPLISQGQKDGNFSAKE